MSRIVLTAILLILCPGSVGMVPDQEPVAVSGLLQHAQYDAPVTLPKILGQGMVLQREEPIPVWGRTHPGAVLCPQNGPIFSFLTA
ncbi:MAG TPA: hypothetical protein PKV47_05875 [Bacteroidales bacterium]|nr:hypothetical protein [Bacteroidales bacterium]